MKTVFLRALEADDKAAALLDAIRMPESAQGKHRFEVDPTSFASVPSSPFAYWVSERLRRLFKELPPFGTNGRTAIQGLATSDDFRFVRAWWAVPPDRLGNKWFPFAKGGPVSPFYADVNLVVNWARTVPEAQELKAFAERTPGTTHWSRRIPSPEFYFRPGLTWPLRANRFAPQPLPAGCVFSARGYCAFVPKEALGSTLAIFNSSVFDYLFKMTLGRFGFPEFIVGVLQRLPWRVPQGELEVAGLSSLARRAWLLKRSLDSRSETSHAFTLPALLQVEGATLSARSAVWTDRARNIEAELTVIQVEIDARCFALYDIDAADHRTITEGLGNAASPPEEANADVLRSAEDDADEAEDMAADIGSVTAELISWAVGVAFGRFDVRLAIGDRALKTEPEPFDPLPVCAPAMLTGADGLPAAIAPAGYPRAFPENGVLVDDPGHPRDLTAAVRAVFGTVFGTRVDAWWNEVAALLDPKDHDLRAWIGSNFFEHHLKRYSKSRRKAPILWQLATPSGRYSVWLYIHRLTRDTFFQLQNQSDGIVAQKLSHEERQLTSLVRAAGDSPSANERKKIAAHAAFVEELRALLDEVKRVTPLWNPTLDDGVVLVMAPLWRLVPQHKPWQKELKSKWDELVAAKYDWAHLAMHLWPERVLPKCATDRSLAIAHGVEDIFWVEGADGKWKPRATPTRSVQNLVRERSSPAVKAALESLLDAPLATTGGGRGRRAGGKKREP